MATHPSSYFISKFITNYVVTAQDMQDLVDSVLFIFNNSGNIFTDEFFGWSQKYQLVITPFDNPSSVDMSSLNLIKLPLFLNCNPISVNFSNNMITRFFIPNNWATLVSLDISNNELNSFSTTPMLTNLKNLHLQGNNLNAAIIEQLLQPLAACGCSVAIYLQDGTNAGHSTWSSAAFASEATIIANGGSVTSNP